MDLQKGRAKTITVVPSAPLGTPRAVVYDGDGDVVDVTVTCTASAVSTTVAQNAANSRQRVELTSTTGVAHGLTVLVTDENFGSARAVISGLEGADVVRFVEPLPAVPADGSTVVGLDVECALPAFDDFATGYVLELDDAADAEVEPVRVAFNVVRFPYLGPCRAEHVRDLIAQRWSGERAFLADAQRHAKIAAEVNDQLRARLLASGVYASTYWDPAALQSVRPALLDWVLCTQHSLRETGVDPGAYRQALEREVEIRVGQILKGAQLRDVDRDEAVSADEAAGAGQSIVRMVR